MSLKEHIPYLQTNIIATLTTNKKIWSPQTFEIFNLYKYCIHNRDIASAACDSSVEFQMPEPSGSLTVRGKWWEWGFNNMKREIQLPTSFVFAEFNCNSPPPPPAPFFLLSPFARLRSYTMASSTPCPSCHHTTKYWNNVPLNLTGLLIKRAIWLLITKLPSHYVVLSMNLLTNSSQEHPPLLASEWILPIQFAGCSKLKMPADC